MSRSHRFIMFSLALSVLGLVIREYTQVPKETLLPVAEPSTPRNEPIPTETDQAWAKEHFSDNWDAIERSYPIASVRLQFAHVMNRVRSGNMVLNISIAQNAASANVNC
ncbi:MAG: hypothetical protein UY81_C0046G0005 [Candidatus Giovannonibacteria bacterium GW2011_GWA2_53_7]|uniref:Uncharacterized protein n=1 Tax=Candidatus Giovannonibacteria bacterium GW2011_GWA2_53_7 TaxID=1618650 RepID=A0A0G2A357_9BACT|nr:MAG: hypothetical protein UY81_C0046G0005 [Candidatus Giovannonibacteria bacterium GW2011_GWA2_53_7]